MEEKESIIFPMPTPLWQVRGSGLCWLLLIRKPVQDFEMTC